MEYFKTNQLVEFVKGKFPDITLTEIAVAFRYASVKTHNYGKCVKPICVFIKGSKDEKAKIQDISFTFNIPNEIIDMIDIIKPEFGVIVIDPTKVKTYTDPEGVDHEFYDKTFAIVRNPAMIEQLKKMEKDSIKFSEYFF